MYTRCLQTRKPLAAAQLQPQSTSTDVRLKYNDYESGSIFRIQIVQKQMDSRRCVVKFAFVNSTVVGCRVTIKYENICDVM